MIEIVPLAKHPEYIPTLAVWIEKEFSYLFPEKTAKDYEKDLQKRLQEKKLPLTLIALDHKELVGTAALREYDASIDAHFSTPQKYSPWLGAVIVNSKKRGQGIGSILVKKTMKKAHELGYKKLYLFTCGQEKFYEKLGWKKITSTTLHKTFATIMYIDL